MAMAVVAVVFPNNTHTHTHRDSSIFDIPVSIMTVGRLKEESGALN